MEILQCPSEIVLSLEPRAFLTFRFSVGGGSGHALGIMLELFWVPLGLPWGALGATWELLAGPWDTLGVTLGSLCWSLAAFGQLLGALWQHFQIPWVPSWGSSLFV